MALGTLCSRAFCPHATMRHENGNFHMYVKTKHSVILNMQIRLLKMSPMTRLFPPYVASPLLLQAHVPALKLFHGLSPARFWLAPVLRLPRSCTSTEKPRSEYSCHKKKVRTSACVAANFNKKTRCLPPLPSKCLCCLTCPPLTLFPSCPGLHMGGLHSSVLRIRTAAPSVGT